MTKLTTGIMNNSKSHGDQPMLRILGISKQGNLKAINKITTMIGSQTGRPVYFARVKEGRQPP
jgi:hypothetical protein